MMLTRDKKVTRIGVVISLMLIGLSCGWTIITMNKGLILANEAPWSNPPEPFDESLLAGTWTTNYMGWGEDTIIIQPDGTFKQVYQDRNVDNGKFTYETHWNNWWVEQLSDGRTHLHLEGAKYFLGGTSFSNDLNIPCPEKDSSNCKDGSFLISFDMYDWIGKEFINMSDELILNIRIDSKGNIILVHMWSSSDRGFPIIGGESEIFRKEDQQRLE